MTNIIKYKTGKITYLYESTSYRNHEGKPRNLRKCVGRIDPKTGQEIFNPEYIERVLGTEKEPNLKKLKIYTPEEVINSCNKEYGVYYLLTNIANSIGLSEALLAAIPDDSERILTLANFMVATGEAPIYCEDWLKKTEGINPAELSSQNISELLLSITDSERYLFYEKWANNRKEHELFALDITSVSSYSELIGDIAWGYNRDGDKLPQINICMLVGENSKLPIFQMIYNGALKDVSTLKTTLELASGLDLSNISIVMDKGFASKKNIDDMVYAKEKTRFLVSLPFTMNLPKQLINNERQTIIKPDNVIILGKNILRGITRPTYWDSKLKLNAHIFYNPTTALSKREELVGHVGMIKEMLLSGMNIKNYSKDIDKYLLIRNTITKNSGIKVSILEKEIDKATAYAGWMVILSNFIKNPQEALEIYRAKDVVEKNFFRLKNFIDLNRLRVHSDTAMHNRLFVGFIAQILTAKIHSVMTDKQLYKRMTMKQLIKKLETLRIIHIKGKQLLTPLTSDHKEIFQAFDIPLPV
jgi:transposase